MSGLTGLGHMELLCQHPLRVMEDLRHDLCSLGSAVADVLVEYGGLVTVKQMFVRQIPKSGRTPDDVLRHLGLSVEDIVKTAVDILAVAPR
jgi:transketolase C-terminal domain/subunit